MRSLRLALAAFAALSLSACVAVKEPIGTSAGYVNDPALEGLWRGKSSDDGPEGYYHVILNDDRTMTVVGIVPKTPDKKASWGTLELTTVMLGANRYLNARETGEDGGPPKDKDAAGSIPLYYTISGDTLSLFTFDEKKVTQAIRAGRIAGRIDSSKVGSMTIDTVSITADGPQLDAWLKSPDAPALFEPVMTLHR
ncbi:MAG TPA: hypothetical protein VNU97_12630 [Rhizomicrobium sp.]|jgi:hypothetical protein|nr:hypothetical protein [Rhizomicrobium sp.]